MNILFITSSRIGDAVLSTPLLHYIEQKWPEAKVTIACGPLTVSLFEGYPLLERILPLEKKKYHRHWVELWQQVVGTRWDITVDLRNSAVSRLIRANQRYIFGVHIHPGLHKVEQNAAVMKIQPPPAPKIWFTEAQEEQAAKFIPEGGPVLAVGPAANWRAKTWPAERFSEVMTWLTKPSGFMAGARVAVFAAPGEEEVAHEVLESVPVARQIDMIAKADPGTAAACLARCDFYLGNDSGLMHCAAAVGTPTLGLFGPSYPHLYRPWGRDAHYIQTPQSFDELRNYEGYTAKTAPCLMEGLTLESVKKKLEEIFENQKPELEKQSGI